MKTATLFSSALGWSKVLVAGALTCGMVLGQEQNGAGSTQPVGKTPPRPLPARVLSYSPGAFEFGVFGGASYGDTSVGNESRYMFGGNVTLAASKRLLVYGEYTFLPGMGKTLNGTFSQSGGGYTLQYGVRVHDIHGGIHYNMPRLAFGSTKPMLPYFALGAGVLSTWALTATATYSTASGATAKQQLPIASATTPAINGGLGGRISFGEGWGMRLEAKAYVPFGGSFGGPFGKVEVGFFKEKKR